MNDSCFFCLIAVFKAGDDNGGNDFMVPWRRRQKTRTTRSLIEQKGEWILRSGSYERKKSSVDRKEMKEPSL
ncbi:hypothetical protein KCU99_g40, partial [Aureobasidium melanogenum]